MRRQDKRIEKGACMTGRTICSVSLVGVILLLFALLVPQSIHAAHPSIFFSSGDIPAIRTKATTSHSAIMQPILSLAASLLPLPVPTAPVGADYTNLSLDSRDIMVLAFAFVATGDSRYLSLGRQYLVYLRLMAILGRRRHARRPRSVAGVHAQGVRHGIRLAV